jgi:hypothetical protein
LIDIAVHPELRFKDVFSFLVAVNFDEWLFGNKSVLFQFDQLVIELSASIGERIGNHKRRSHVDCLENVPQVHQQQLWLADALIIQVHFAQHKSRSKFWLS